MKTNLGKIFAVFTTLVCLAFMAVSVIVSIAGPNWQAMSFQLEGEGYKFARSPDGTWAAVRARDGGAVKSSKIFPEVLLACYKDLDSTFYSPETTNVTNVNKQLEEQIKSVEKAIQEDQKALQVHFDSQLKNIDDTRTVRQDVGKQVVKTAERVQESQAELNLRREDVYRIRTQVKEVAADQFRLQQAAQQLKDQIAQLDGGLERAEQRRQQLEHKPTVPYNEPGQQTNE